MHCELELAELKTKLERMLLSILPVIAEAAGISMGEMGWQELAGLRSRKFVGLEAVQ